MSGHVHWIQRHQVAVDQTSLCGYRDDHKNLNHEPNIIHHRLKWVQCPSPIHEAIGLSRCATDSNQTGLCFLTPWYSGAWSAFFRQNECVHRVPSLQPWHYERSATRSRPRVIRVQIFCRFCEACDQLIITPIERCCLGCTPNRITRESKIELHYPASAFFKGSCQCCLRLASSKIAKEQLCYLLCVCRWPYDVCYVLQLRAW